MSIHDRDYILRTIRQMVEALGRLVGLPGAPPTEAQRTIDETGQSLFGPLYRTLRDADATTAAALVSDPEKRWALAALLFEEGRASELSGDGRAAQRRFRTAAELLLDLLAPGSLPVHAAETLSAVAPRIDRARLSEARRRTLEAFERRVPAAG
jgi:hypothetical protein